MRMLAPIFGVILVAATPPGEGSSSEAATANAAESNVVTTGSRIQEGRNRNSPVVREPIIIPELGENPALNELPDAPCFDVLQEVKEGRVLSAEQDREPSEMSPELHKFYAVDYDIGGCDFLVVSQGGDVRPLPDIPEEAILHPAQ